PKDLLAPILQACSHPAQRTKAFAPFLDIPAIAGLVERVERLQSACGHEQLSSALAEALYGKTLTTSVSRLGQFAACPFKLFVSSGLRADERKYFELDMREQGSFQHEILALFHQELRKEGKRWRDQTPREARERIATAVSSLTETYGRGLLVADDQ